MPQYFQSDIGAIWCLIEYVYVELTVLPLLPATLEMSIMPYCYSISIKQGDTSGCDHEEESIYLFIFFFLAKIRKWEMHKWGQL